MPLLGGCAAFLCHKIINRFFRKKYIHKYALTDRGQKSITHRNRSIQRTGYQTRPLFNNFNNTNLQRVEK